MATQGSGWSSRQRLTVAVFGPAVICQAITVSLQPPFFPDEAEEKGITATHYGLVFGLFELTKIFVSPILGRHLSKIGAKLVFTGGILISSICAVIFGLLHFVRDGQTFIGLCFLTRFFEALGYAGLITSSFTITTQEFPQNVATMFALLQTAFGIGFIVGPTVGGFIYQWGGYTPPFIIFGSLLFLVAVVSAFVLPSPSERTAGSSKGGIFRLLAVPAVALAAFSVVCASSSMGFIGALLEPHLRPYQLNAVPKCLMFVINVAFFATSAPLWGRLCDRLKSPKLVTAFAALLIVASFILLGPAPFLPIQPSLTLIVAALVLHGLGFSGQSVAAFVDANRAAVSNGFPDSIETYGTISGLWGCTFALGACIGPSVSGVLYDNFGFRYASLLIIAMQTLLLILVSAFLCSNREEQQKDVVFDDTCTPSTSSVTSEKYSETMPLISDHSADSQGYYSSLDIGFDNTMR